MNAKARAAESASTDLDKLADYFDRTDAGELPWDEGSEVMIERPELEQISLRLPKEDLLNLKRRASRLGVGHTTLIRMLLHQYLRSPLTR